MPKARKPMPARYAPKGSANSKTVEKTTAQSEQKSGSKNTSGAHDQAARAPKQTQHHPESSTAHLEVPTTIDTASDQTSEKASDTKSAAKDGPVKAVQPVAFCANGFLLANTQRLEDELKLEISLDGGISFVGTPVFPFSKRLERGNTWPNGQSRVGLFPSTDPTGRLLATQQVNSVRNVLETDTVASSFHLVGFPVDTRGLLTVRIYPQRTGMKAFNMIVQATTELLEMATIAGEARNGVEVFGEILEQNGELKLLARTVVGLRLVIPKHHLPGFKPESSGKPHRYTERHKEPSRQSQPSNQ
jgi:hypothetical protein